MSETKMIKFRMNGKPLFAKKIDVNETLFQIRKKFENKLPNGSLFICSDGTEIELEDENDFTLKDIAGNEDKTFIIHLNKKEEDTQNNYGIEKKKVIFHLMTKIKIEMLNNIKKKNITPQMKKQMIITMIEAKKI